MRALALVAIAACAPAPAPPQVALGPVCPRVEPRREPAKVERHESACWKRGRPHAAPPKKPAVDDEDAYCASLDPAEVARVEARVRKEFSITSKPSKLVIDFGCLRASGTPASVVLEDGSGHGGSLRLVRFTRTPMGVDVRSIASSHYYNPGVVYGSGHLAIADFESLVAHAVVPLVARPHLVTLTNPNGIGGGSFSMSSNDFHLLLRIVDDHGDLTERAFTGYDGSSSQGRVIPLRIAAEGFRHVLDTLPLTKENAPTDDDKLFFTQRFVEAMTHANDSFFWWVKERYVSLAVTLGTIDAVPALVAVAQKGGEASADRTRPVALAAIAAITGWDPRVDERGHPRTLDDAAALAAKECAL